AEPCGYHAGAEQRAEPTAMAAMALLAHDRAAPAAPLLDWLLARQNRDGSVGIDVADQAPGWATGWSVMAWQAAGEKEPADKKYAAAIDRALEWMRSFEGSIAEHSQVIGHDTTIKGWPWVVG